MRSVSIGNAIARTENWLPPFGRRIAPAFRTGKAGNLEEPLAGSDYRGRTVRAQRPRYNESNSYSRYKSPTLSKRFNMPGTEFIRARSCAAMLIGILSALPVGNAQTVDFQRDIQPILSDKCWSCHGQDEGTRQAGLRLDEATAALAGGDSGKAIVPGRASESELVARIMSADPEMVMPPPKAQKPLTASERGLLKDWIDQGAEFATHWAFSPPTKAPLPVEAARTNSDLQPIDAWVQYGLAQQKLRPSPRAESSVLCRRLYLDLIGLPPTPREIEEYQRVGHAATVQGLMASPRFGEKWARHWLDVARYSDTNGYEKDLPREQWIWRDWVVQAFNDDLPYDRFIIEQIAGDLLPAATQEQIVATGFLRNSMLNEEGAIVPEQFRMVEMFDRMDCIGKAVLGLTIQCAQCHSHKFDPLTHTEYFGMFAFLNNAYEAQSYVFTPAQQRTITELRANVDRLVSAAKAQVSKWHEARDEWSQQVLEQQSDWQPIEFNDLGSNSGLNHPVQLDDKSVLMLGHSSADVYMISQPDLSGVTGLRLETLTHGDLPHRGPGRSKTGTWNLLELEAFVKTPGIKDWQKLKLGSATADFSEPESGAPAAKDAKKADSAAKESKKRSGPVAFLVDGSDDTSWQGDRGPGLRNQEGVAVVQFEKPLDAPPGSELKIALRATEMLGCGRFSLTKSAAPRALPVNHSAVLALQRPSAQRCEAEERAIDLAWIASRADCQTIAADIDAQWAKMPAGFTTVLHLAERTGAAQRPTHFLDRGEWDQPKQVVQPHTPRIFHALDGDSPKDRLGFANWLVDRRSPLAARVAVNRLWQAVFGEGLVETAEDFGTRAAVPEHRELLDWLAVDFMEHGWSQKHILSLIVTSETYQQSSHITPELHERDPRNRWLARGPRFRADAEVVRDIALSVSGLIAHKLGGPSVIPPVPQNVLDYNYVYPSYWTPATGPDRYRRTLYGFRKRSMPDPVMSNLDGPNGDFACARRTRSNTPMAALTGLNETIFFECAQALGLRVVREGGEQDEQRAAYAFRLCTGREPQRRERDEILALLQSRRSKLADGWLNPREVITGDPGQLPELPAVATPQTAAAWILVSRVLLNLDETLTKN